MTYYIIKPEDIRSMSELNIRRDEVRAIWEKLDEKYPLANGCKSYDERQAHGQEYRNQRYYFERDLKLLTSDIHAHRKVHGQEILNEIGFPMMGKRRADLVAECARWMQLNNVKEAYIINYVFAEGEQWEVAQSWFVLEEGGHYYFKQRRDCKAKHLIEGVVA